MFHCGMFTISSIEKGVFYSEKDIEKQMEAGLLVASCSGNGIYHGSGRYAGGCIIIS